MEQEKYFLGRRKSDGHFRQTSLGSFKGKTSLDSKKSQPVALFQRSLTSFSMKSEKRYKRHDSQEIKGHSKEIDNIYFNPKSRENFFKNLIDSYFQKGEKTMVSSAPNSNPPSKRQPHFRKTSILSMINSKEKYELQKQSSQLETNLNSNPKVFRKARIQNSKNMQKESSTLSKDSLSWAKSGKNPDQDNLSNSVLIGTNQEQQKKLGVFSSKINRYSKMKNKISSNEGVSNEIGLIQPSDALENYKQSPTDNTIFRSGSGFNLPDSSFLPKITEMADDDPEEGQKYLDRTKGASSVNLSEQGKNQILRMTYNSSNWEQFRDEKHLVFQNSILKIYIVGQPKSAKRHRIKEFKDRIFIERHNKIKEYTKNQSQLMSLWKPYKYCEFSLISPVYISLKDHLMQITEHPQFPDTVILSPKPFYYTLMKNRSHELYQLFKTLIKDLLPVSTKVINNKINPSNLFYLKGKLVLGDWEYSAYRDQAEIQSNQFQSRTEPLLQCQREWLVTPEYLAPEILQSVIEYKKPFDLWKYDNASDVYSIGLTFLEIITQVPIWIDRKVLVQQAKNTIKPRKGFLSTQKRSVRKIIEKQLNLQEMFEKAIEREVPEEYRNNKFYSLLLKMIEPNPEKRPSIKEISNLFK